jgi:hypothetical protein
MGEGEMTGGCGKTLETLPVPRHLTARNPNSMETTDE